MPHGLWVNRNGGPEDFGSTISGYQKGRGHWNKNGKAVYRSRSCDGGKDRVE